MIEWISQINPNILLGVITAVLGLLHVAKSQGKSENIADALESALMQQVYKLADDPQYRDKARDVLEKAADDLLARMNIKRDSVSMIVHVAIEAALHELEQLIDERKQGAVSVKDALAKLSDGAQKVLDAFTPPAKPLGLDWPAAPPVPAVPPAPPDPKP
jgi:hypothetical protein